MGKDFETTLQHALKKGMRFYKKWEGRTLTADDWYTIIDWGQYFKTELEQAVYCLAIEYLEKL